MESKLPQFLASESNDEFRRKKMEFETYVDRADIKGKEEADDLYRTHIVSSPRFGDFWREISKIWKFLARNLHFLATISRKM